MNWAIGIYVTCAGIWGLVWAVSAGIALGEWRGDRDKNYREEQAVKARGGFIGSMVMAACTPIWPVPVMVFAYKGIRSLARDVKRAAIEEAAEAAKKIQDKP